MRRMILSLALVSAATAVWAQPSTPLQPLPVQPIPDAQAPLPDTSSPDQVPDLQPVPPPQGQGQAPAPDRAQGQGRGQPQGQARADRPVPRAPETDEQLLNRLAKAPDRRGARDIERELRARWSHSGSPSADLLLKRVDDAVEAHAFDTAREIVNKLTEIAPDFAEAWHRRATIAAQKEDYEDAITSLRNTLSLQPKHFVALAELGGILEEYNDKPHALEALRKAQELDPFIDGVEDRVKNLTKAVEGQGI
jgi:tetratricopeptide (TPR) repeat protein